MGFMTLINSFNKFLTTMCQERALSSNWINEEVRDNKWIKIIQG